MPMSRTCLPLTLTLFLGTSILGASDNHTDRIAQVEAVMDRFFRGESVEEARLRVVAQVDAYNALAKSRTGELEAQRAKVEQLMAPVREQAAKLEAMDKELANRPAVPSEDDIKRLNALAKKRNEFAHQYNANRESAQREVDAYNAQREKVDAELDAARTKVNAEQAKINARIDAWGKFLRGGGEGAFYAQVNGLFVELMASGRTGTPRTDEVEKLRSIRRELVRWAVARTVREQGPLLVEATVAGEPCCLMVDTGAQKTTLSPQMVDALGLVPSQEEATLILAGGVQIRGRRVELPSLVVAGATESKVSALVVPASEVGVDGLLGLNVLRKFTVTLAPDGKGGLTLSLR
jgi:clan AA aspartic protease (TIGR02281 family)